MPQHQPPVYTIGQDNLIFVVWICEGDDLPHADERPFCLDPECPCKEDSNLVREYITVPLDKGLLTNAEAIRLYFGKQLTPSQDERITDEEIEQIMAAPSPLDAEIEENYHRPLRISAQFQRQMDKLLIDHD